MCKVISFEEVRKLQRKRIAQLVDYPNATEVTGIELDKDRNGNPAAVITVKRGGVVYEAPLVNGLQIHLFNNFLKSLNLGLKVNFQCYLQYGRLLDDFNRALQEKGAKV